MGLSSATFHLLTSSSEEGERQASRYLVLQGGHELINRNLGLSQNGFQRFRREVAAMPRNDDPKVYFCRMAQIRVAPRLVVNVETCA